MGTIKINLLKNDYSDAIRCEEDEIINKTQKDRFEAIVNNLILQSNQDDYDNIINDHFHNTISIFGNRGAGKTTFLRTALHYIADEHKDVVVLDIMDPSILERKQHPFINIIAYIEERVDQYTSESYFNSYNRQLNKEDLEGYKKAYKDLLEGLPFIDGVGTKNIYNEWDDDCYVSMQGMKKAEASNKLVKNFKVYVYKALKVLNKKCFVIPFDDIDTNINKGFEILEVIRKYLVTRQVISILTGDLDLYSKLVRKASWHSFTIDFLNKEKEYSKRNPDEFSNMINHLENQYLLKILKPENRIHLKTIREVIDLDDKEINVIISRNENYGTPIGECYRSILKKIGFITDNTRDAEQIINFIEGLSVRTQIRLLNLYKGIALSEEESDFTYKFINIFWTDIKQNTPEAKSLVSYDKYYTVDMMRFLIDTKSLDYCSDFMPHTNDDTLNKALLAISAQYINQSKKSSFMIFDFWVRISYIKYLYDNIKTKDNTDIYGLIKYSSILEHDDLAKCIGLSEAFTRSIFKSLSLPTKTIPGTILIDDNILYTRRELNQFLDIISYGTYDKSNTLTRYVSIYKLFAILRDFLYFNSNNSNSNKIKASTYYLRKLSQFRGYLEPLQTNENHTFTKTFDNQYDYVEDFDQMIVKWGELSKDLGLWNLKYKDINVSPQLLNRIFTRTFFTMINIDKDYSYNNLGQKINAYISALLNSVLVESYFDIDNNNSRNIKDGIIIDNQKDIEYIFKRNILYIGSTKEIPLLDWLIDCPLIKLFMNPDYYNLIRNRYDYTEKELYVLEKTFRERYFESRINVTERNLKSYYKLYDSLLSANKWLELYRLRDNNKELKKITFSLEPLEKEIIILDINMSDNLLFLQTEKISFSFDKLIKLIYNAEDYIKQLRLLYNKKRNISELKIEEKHNSKDGYPVDFEHEFYKFTCSIKI